MLKVGWVMLYALCSKFHTLSSSVKIFENRLRFDKVTESLKVGTFFGDTVYIGLPGLRCACCDS